MQKVYGFAKGWKRVDVQDSKRPGALRAANVVYSLRRKIGEGYVETVVGSGYRFVG